MISPCVDILRQLTTQINHDLGSRQGSKHASPDLSRDINELMKSLREHRVYTVERGRVIEGEKALVPNLVSSGLRALPKPLREYNSTFLKLQARRRMTPLIGTPAARQREQSLQIGIHSQTSATEAGHGHDPSTSDAARGSSDANPYVDEDDFSESDVEEDGNDDPEKELLPRESEDDVELYLD